MQYVSSMSKAPNIVLLLSFYLLTLGTVTTSFDLLKTFVGGRQFKIQKVYDKKYVGRILYIYIYRYMCTTDRYTLHGARHTHTHIYIYRYRYRSIEAVRAFVKLSLTVLPTRETQRSRKI
jgi:hypothetical protein